MAKVRIVLNRKGVRELLKSPEMRAMLNERAQNIKARLGDGYKADTYVGSNRVNAMVWASTRKTIKDDLDNNTIIKAMGSER